MKIYSGPQPRKVMHMGGELQTDMSAPLKKSPCSPPVFLNSVLALFNTPPALLSWSLTTVNIPNTKTLLLDEAGVIDALSQ